LFTVFAHANKPIARLGKGVKLRLVLRVFDGRRGDGGLAGFPLGGVRLAAAAAQSLEGL